LLVVRETDFTVLSASDNAASLLRLTADSVRRNLAELDTDLLERIAPVLSGPLDVLPMAVRVGVGPNRQEFVDNRDPASDIPQMARRLYERKRVRVLLDVLYAPVPISTGKFDMSLCGLRSMSRYTSSICVT
jgi:light-regulated signal transduction histidine kinase (bacteriophytochrome)